ncbi:MAG: 5-oxoprolinase subunit PxpA [Acidobacteriota bacterium]
MGHATSPPRIDFNCDMGESFGAYRLGLDDQIIRSVTSANIACGFHAGDPAWMRRTVALAEQHGVGVGAHPGFPDLRGFGRRNLDLSPSDVRDDVLYQIGALTAFTRDKRLQHVKPHGALYNMAVEHDALASAICDAVVEADPHAILVVLAGSRWVDLARRAGLRVGREVFADRAFTAQGTLVPRSTPGSVIHDVNAVIERSLRLVTEGQVTAITGERVDLEADTICLHGDTPGSVQLAAALREAFEGAGVELVPLGRMLGA